MKKWTFLKDEQQVVALDSGELVFDTSDLGSESMDINTVIEKIVNLNNTGNGLDEFDDYLLEEMLCSEEDREQIIERSFLFLSTQK